MSKKVEIIPGEMEDIDVNFISLVKKGANKQRISIYKGDDYEEPGTETTEDDEVKGFFNVVKSFFAGARREVAKEDAKPKKPTDFTAVIQAQNIDNNISSARWVLSDIIRNILADEAITDKKTQIGKQIDSFKTYVLGELDRVGIKKAADLLDREPIAKAGKKISATRLESIKTAITALQSIVNEVEAPNNDEGGDVDVKKEELTDVVKSAVAEIVKPINERLDKIEKGDKPEGGEQTASAAQTPTETDIKKEDIVDIVKSAVTEAVKPIEDRLATVEKARGISKANEDSEEDAENKNNVAKSDSVFSGFFA